MSSREVGGVGAPRTAFEERGEDSEGSEHLVVQSMEDHNDDAMHGHLQHASSLHAQHTMELDGEDEGEDEEDRDEGLMVS